MLTINSATPVLRVSDVSRTIAWYRDMLGFTADPFPATPPYEFAILEHGGTRIMVRHAPSYRCAPEQKSWDIYISLGGGHIREVYADLQGRGEISRPLERMPYGDVEFDVRDPDGYVLCLSELLMEVKDIPLATA
jgi:uncharacterized glyoxalase superfamily protein PhnB